MGQQYLKHTSDDSYMIAPKIRLKLDADLVITTSTLTEIPDWQTETFDPNNLHNPTTNPERITFAIAGTYVIGFSVQWASSATGEREIQTWINGSSAIAKVKQNATAGGETQEAITLWNVAVDDYVSGKVLHTRGSNLSVKKTSSTSLWAYRVN